MGVIAQYFRDLAGFPRDGWDTEWRPLSRPEAIGGLLFFVWFLWYAIGKEGGDFLFLDSGNAVIHEGGHALFSYFPQFVTVAGGTILQLLVPFLLALAFYVRRQAVGTSLFLVVMFENFLGISKYMADARAMALQYIAIGAGVMSGDEMDPNMHDWHYMFTRLGVLDQDTHIAAIVFKLGWAGMIGTVLWFAYRCYRNWRENGWRTAGWEAMQ